MMNLRREPRLGGQHPSECEILDEMRMRPLDGYEARESNGAPKSADVHARHTARRDSLEHLVVRRAPEAASEFGGQHHANADDRFDSGDGVYHTRPSTAFTRRCPTRGYGARFWSVSPSSTPPDPY